jgi:hypothetical protein
MSELDLNENVKDAAHLEAIQNRENFESNVQNLWGHSSLGIEAKRAAMTMLSTKTGMYARIPLVCKSDDCPYSESCQLLSYNLAPTGEYCPMETAQIEIRFHGYSQDFDLDTASFTDKNLVSEIINYDIMIERCKALIAKEGVLVIDVIAGATEQGELFYRPEVSKHLEAHDKLTRRRNEVYQLMMATRRDKKGEVDASQSITDILAGIASAEYVIDEKPE